MLWFVEGVTDYYTFKLFLKNNDFSDFEYKFIKCDNDSINKEKSGTEKILLRMIYDNKVLDYTFIFDIIDDSPNLLKIWSDIYEKQKSKLLR